MTNAVRILTQDGEAQPRRVRHGDDLYGWVEQQVALLRAGRAAEIDAGLVAEELQDVGSEQFDKLESALCIVLLHMLKWDQQPSRRTRSWQLSIAAQRLQVNKVLRRNPGLKSRIDEALADAYQQSRIEAARETRLALSRFPPDCPYAWAEITERAFEIDNPR
jgi:hypothetical protein